MLRHLTQELLRLVDVQDVRGFLRPAELVLRGTGGDDERRPRPREMIVEHLGGHRRLTRNDYGSHLEAGEHDLEPVDLHPHEHQHPVSRPHAALAKQRRPACAALREDQKRARLDDPVLSEDGHRLPLVVVSERFDDVAREVETVRDLPAPVREGWVQGELEG